jgi:hypothetical protein
LRPRSSQTVGYPTVGEALSLLAAERRALIKIEPDPRQEVEYQEQELTGTAKNAPLFNVYGFVP